MSSCGNGRLGVANVLGGVVTEDSLGKMILFLYNSTHLYVLNGIHDVLQHNSRACIGWVWLSYWCSDVAKENRDDVPNSKDRRRGRGYEFSVFECRDYSASYVCLPQSTAWSSRIHHWGFPLPPYVEARTK